MPHRWDSAFQILESRWTALNQRRSTPRSHIRCVLNDRVVNVLEDHIDLAVRIGELPDSSSLITTRVGSVRRVVCGSPSYFAQRGVPETCTNASPSKTGSLFQTSGSSRGPGPTSLSQFIRA